MIGAKVMILCFDMFARLSQGYSAFSHIGNWAEIFHMNPGRNWSQYNGHSGQSGSCEEAPQFS